MGLRETTIGLIAFSLFFGCSGNGDEERPPGIDGTFGEGTPMPECEEPPQPDTDAACGSETVPLFSRTPTIYFVLDTSGSMLDFIPEGGDTKLDAAKSALNTVVREVGHRIKYGLTTFPGPDTANNAGCAPGEEIFAVSAGDPIKCINRPANGPTFTSFARQLARAESGGATPLAPTLEELAPSLIGREDQTAVILITDGSPNCGTEETCSISSCYPSLYGLNVQGADGHELTCTEEINCCDPAIAPGVDPQFACVDEDASVHQLERLRDAGVFTYVIGVLGTEDFDNVMNSLAIAGGKPREGSRKYYDVESLSELTQTVRAIGIDLTQSCDIELVDPPIFPDQFNVYFDGEVVPRNEDDGWTLEDAVVTLHGDACDEMQSGNVTEVQLLSGCDTIVR